MAATKYTIKELLSEDPGYCELIKKYLFQDKYIYEYNETTVYHEFDLIFRKAAGNISLLTCTTKTTSGPFDDTKWKPFVLQEYVEYITSITGDYPIIVPHGGIEAGEELKRAKVSDVVKKILYPYVAPICSSVNEVLKEKGQSITNDTITTNFQIQSERRPSYLKITSYAQAIHNGKHEDLNGGIKIDLENFVNPVNNPYSTEINLINSSRTLEVEVNDGAKVNYYPLKKYFFYYPIYLGLVDPEYTKTINATTLTQTPKRIVHPLDTIDFEAFITGSRRTLIYAIPESYCTGQTFMAYDQNGLDLSRVFDITKVNMLMSDSLTREYRIYSLKDLSNANSDSFKLSIGYKGVDKYEL